MYDCKICICEICLCTTYSYFYNTQIYMYNCILNTYFVKVQHKF